MIHNRARALGTGEHSGYTARQSHDAQELRQDIATMTPAEIKPMIEAGFGAAIVTVESDDNTHFGTLVVATEFEGKRPLARHQLVYKTLGNLVGNEIHALTISALTPEEWRQQRQGD